MTNISNGDTTLATWGEFRVINEVILPRLRSIAPAKPLGDDCAFVEIGDGKNEMVVTSDVGPRPLSWKLGWESYWSWGWYSVIVNLSDIASAGAQPVTFCSSIDAPPDMRIKDFDEFFRGIADACVAYGVTSSGGNVRASTRFACHGFAVGRVPAGARVGRTGCSPGDHLVAIGECGRFMATFLRVRQAGKDVASAEDYERLTRPVARVREMAVLREAQLLTAATDNSDGVLGSIWNIAERSGCGFTLSICDQDISRDVSTAARHHGIHPWNLLLCWGDWQIIATIPVAQMRHFEEVTAMESIPYMVLGKAVDTEPAIFADVGGTRRRMRVIRNENFAPSSFNADLDVHLDYMLRSELFE